MRDVSTSATVCTSRGVILSRRLDSNQHHRLERGKSYVVYNGGCTFLPTLRQLDDLGIKNATTDGHWYANLIDCFVYLEVQYCTLVPPGKEGDEVLQPGLEPELSALKGRRLSQFVYSRIIGLTTGFEPASPSKPSVASAILPT